MRKRKLYIIPLIAILYTIAFFEIEIGGVQQTWGDEFDSYVTSSHSGNIGTQDYNAVDFDLTFTPLHSLHYFIPSNLQVVQGFNQSNDFPEAASRLFIRNCSWLI